MARGRSGGAVAEQRFGVEPVAGVIDAGTARPMLHDARVNLGAAEASVKAAAGTLGEVDEIGRAFLTSDPPMTDLSFLGDASLKLDTAVVELTRALAGAVRCREVLRACIYASQNGKPVDFATT